MKRLFLALSRNRWLKDNLSRLGIFKRFAARFVAGETLPDALRVAEQLNNKGIHAIINYLGEEIKDPQEARSATQEYLEGLKQISLKGIKGYSSLKLTQIGLDISQDLCLKNLLEILGCAARYGRFVRIDMEGSAYTDRTLQIYRSVGSKYTNIGIVIQAYLYRSQADINRLMDGMEGINVRLCKGAYDEPKSVAFPKKRDVDRNFIRLTELLLANSKAFVAIATHDERIIEQVKGLAREKGISRERFEFQLLYGIRRDLQLGLKDEGFKVSVYIPYGTFWYPYFLRRLGERPENLLFLLKHLVKG
jgi:proline dehydrogenase